MNDWRGLHNPKRHGIRPPWEIAYCSECNFDCDADRLCRCCLEAEVERLAAELADRDRRIEAALTLHTSKVPNVIAFQSEYDGSAVDAEGHWVTCDCCDVAGWAAAQDDFEVCPDAKRTCLGCGDPAPCATERALRGDS